MVTSYTTHSPADASDRTQVREAHLMTFVHGAARAVLDTAEVVTDDPNPSETRYADATWWHAPVNGWELEAIHPDDRERFVARVRQFVEDNYGDLTEVAANTLREGSAPFPGESGGWYRAGYLYPYSCNGEGIGLGDHGPAGERAHKAAGHRELHAEAQPEGHPEGRYVRVDVS